MSFAGLLLAYGILRGGSDIWRCTEELAKKTGCQPQPVLGINFTAALTFLLICSSVTMVLAVAASMEGNRKGTMKYLALTILGGILFLCGQYQEWFGFNGQGLLHEGLTFGSTNYATTFYLITGFHGMHVTTGVIYLSVILFQTSRGWYDNGNYNRIELVGLFWHFVDLIWILVFTLVYLIPL